MIVRNLYLGASRINKIYRGKVVIWNSGTPIYLEYIVDCIIRSNEDLYCPQIHLTQIQGNSLCYIVLKDTLYAKTYDPVFRSYDVKEHLYDNDDNSIKVISIPIILLQHDAKNAYDVQVAPTKRAVGAIGRAIRRFEDHTVTVEELVTSVAGIAEFVARNENNVIYITELATFIVGNAAFGVRYEWQDIYVTEDVATRAGYARIIERYENNTIRVAYFNTSKTGIAKFASREADITLYTKGSASSWIAGVKEIFFERRIQPIVDDEVIGKLAESKIAYYDWYINTFVQTNGGDPVSEIVKLYQDYVFVFPTASNSFLDYMNVGSFHHDLTCKMPKIEELNSICCEAPLGVHTLNQFEKAEADLSNIKISSLSFATDYLCETEASASIGLYFKPIKTDKNLYIKQVHTVIPNDKNLKIN